jgi:hypothetical protein
MLILVAVVFFHQDVRLDGPTMPGAEVAALMDCGALQPTIGDPGMP